MILLLEAGSDPNMRDLNKKTPLHILADKHPDLVQTFISHVWTEIDYTLKDQNGHMAF